MKSPVADTLQGDLSVVFSPDGKTLASAGLDRNSVVGSIAKP